MIRTEYKRILDTDEKILDLIDSTYQSFYDWITNEDTIEVINAKASDSAIERLREFLESDYELMRMKTLPKQRTYEDNYQEDRETLDRILEGLRETED